MACKVLAIADWAEEYNQLRPHPIPEIPAALLALYSGSLQARGQFPLPLSVEEIGVTNVRTRSQVMWIFLCTILQYFEDDMAAHEGALYGGRTWQPSALILYIMECVNPGLPEDYRVHWPNIVGKTPWLAAQDHMSQDELHRFSQEPGLDTLSELEQATEDVYHRQVEEEAQKNRVVLPSLRPMLMGLRSAALWAPNLHHMETSRTHNHPSQRLSPTSSSPDWIGIW